MKKWILALAAAGMLAAPVCAAEASSIVVNGEAQGQKPDAAQLFSENNLVMIPVRWLAGQCGISAQSGRTALPLVKAAAEQSGLEMRWNADTDTAYFIGKNCILYENRDLGIGVFAPEEYADSFRVLENRSASGITLNFFDSGERMLLFSLTHFDLDEWENNVKEVFPVAYSEVYRDSDGLWLCINVSDVQYDPGDAEQKAEYETLLACKDEILSGFYTFTEQDF